MLQVQLQVTTVLLLTFVIQVTNAASDFESCNNVVSVPGNSKNVDDSDCEICANGGQEWYPCDEPGMCYCSDNGGTVPQAYWGPFTPCTKAIAVPGNSKNVQDSACLACSNNGRAFYPCNQPGVLCMCAAGHGYMYNVDTPTTIPPTTQNPSSPTTTTAKPTTTTTTTTSTTTTPTTTTTVPPSSSGGTSANYLIHATFEAREVGFYTKSMTSSDFGVAAPWENGMSEKRLSILTEGSGKTANKFLRVSYPKGGVGPSKGGGQFMLKFANDNEEYQEMYVSYRVRFRPGFNFVKGGKLPGLCGGNCNTGGSKPNGKDGWSARMMWRSKGSAVQYVYYPEQPSKYAEDMYWNYGGDQRSFARSDGSNLGDGKWHTVQTRVLLNNIGAGVRDGKIQSWFDGKQALNKGDMRFRFTGRLAIDTLYFSTFFGGSGSQWAPTANEYADFDDIIVSTKPILDGVNSAIFSSPTSSLMEPMAAPVVVDFVLNGDHFGPLVSNAANKQTLKTALASDLAVALFDDATQADRIVITNVTVGSLYVESHINPLPSSQTTTSSPSSSSAEASAEAMIASLDNGCCLSVGEVQRRMTQLFNGTVPPVEDGEGGDFAPTDTNSTTSNENTSSSSPTDTNSPTTPTSWLNSTLSFYVSANTAAGNTNVSITDVSLRSEPSVLSAPTPPPTNTVEDDDNGLPSQTIYIIVAVCVGCVAVLALVGALIMKNKKSGASRRMGDNTDHLVDDGSSPNFFDFNNSSIHHHGGDHNTAYALETLQPPTMIHKESKEGEEFSNAI